MVKIEATAIGHMAWCDHVQEAIGGLVPTAGPYDRVICKAQAIFYIGKPVRSVLMKSKTRPVQLRMTSPRQYRYEQAMPSAAEDGKPSIYGLGKRRLVGYIRHGSATIPTVNGIALA